jgi:response regulator RpfG family c-di-GMP phosphodiesterase
MAVVRGGIPGARIPPGTKLLERLVQEALIEPDDQQRAILHAQRVEGRCEDAIIEIGAMSEQDLLKYLANAYRTRFVTTPKLEKASVGRDVLALVPKKLAEKLLVFPILHDPSTHALSVVVADPSENDIAKQVQLVSRVRDVHMYIARPATIQALIKKHYDGDRGAFAELAARSPTASRAPNPQGPAYAAADYYDDRSLGGGDPLTDPSTGDYPLAPAALAARQKAAGRRVVTIEAPDPGPSAGHAPLRKSEPPEPLPTRRRSAPIMIEAPKAPTEEALAVRATEGVSLADYLATLNVLVALHEQGRGELRGHSSQVARLCRRLAERMGLNEAQRFGTLVAAHIHDIGKGASYHLTALNVAQYEGHRVQAQKTLLSPLRFFESVKLPEQTVQAITHLYERPDGKGFPDKLSGKDIPIGARILALVETYCDLTTHAKNPFRKMLGPKEAIDALARYRDQYFDGNLLDMLSPLVLGDDLKNKLLSDRPTVLLVDPDAEETAVLELRLVEHGFEVAIARTAIDAYERVQKGGIDAVIAEVELTPIDGFEMLLRLRQGGAGAEIPVLFVTKRGDRDGVSRGFEIGAADYLVKPASGDVVAAKVRHVLSSAQKRAAGRGVSGSLSEMALPDVVQILSNGRKSGQLSITARGREGKIFFADGAIWDAQFGGRRGEEAFYEMLLLSDGEFMLDPSVRPTGRVIHLSAEGLLLEGMRRFDEGRR